MKKTVLKKNTVKLPMTGKVRKGFTIYCTVILALAMVFAMSVTVFAAGEDPLTV